MRARFAFSRDSRVSPDPSSKLSSATSTSSPMLIVIFWPRMPPAALQAGVHQNDVGPDVHDASHEDGARLDLLAGQAFFEQLRKTLGHDCFRGRYGPLALTAIQAYKGLLSKTARPAQYLPNHWSISIRSRSFGSADTLANPRQHLIHYIVDGHHRRIEDQGIAGWHKRRNRTTCVAPVTFGDLPRKGGKANI